MGYTQTTHSNPSLCHMTLNNHWTRPTEDQELQCQDCSNRTCFDQSIEDHAGEEGQGTLESAHSTDTFRSRILHGKWDEIAILGFVRSARRMKRPVLFILVWILHDCDVRYM